MLKIAKEAAIRAGKIAQKMRNKGLNAKTKKIASDLVTAADLASEKLIVEALECNFPNHSILTEESGFTDKSSEYTWIIDPIDGTLSFFGGLQIWGISIGLFKNNKPYLGVIFLPDLSEIFYALKGHGAFMNGKRIEVSGEDQLIKAIIASDFGHGDRINEAKEAYLPYLNEVRYAPVYACSVYGGANVAAGKFAAYIHKAYIWDHAASVAIIEEAGGKVTDFKGNKVEWKFNDKMVDVVTSNGFIHDKLLKLLNK